MSHAYRIDKERRLVTTSAWGVVSLRRRFLQ
jgi:hypothetical protein